MARLNTDRRSSFVARLIISFLFFVNSRGVNYRNYLRIGNKLIYPPGRVRARFDFRAYQESSRADFVARAEAASRSNHRIYPPLGRPVRGADARLVSPLFPLEMDGGTPVPTTHRSHRPCHSQPTKRRAPLAHERREDCRILAVTRNTSWRTAYIIGRNNRSRVREHRAIRSVAAARLGIQRSTPFTIPQNSLYVPRERERERNILGLV